MSITPSSEFHRVATRQYLPWFLPSSHSWMWNTVNLTWKIVQKNVKRSGRLIFIRAFYGSRSLGGKNCGLYTPIQHYYHEQRQQRIAWLSFATDYSGSGDLYLKAKWYFCLKTYLAGDSIAGIKQKARIISRFGTCFVAFIRNNSCFTAGNSFNLPHALTTNFVSTRQQSRL